MKKEMETTIITINSGETLCTYLKESGLVIDHYSGIMSSENCIYLPDKTSFNWKSRTGIVRVNCKEAAKNIIVNRTGLSFKANGVGDRTREYSFIIDNEQDLIKVIMALKTIEINCN